VGCRAASPLAAQAPDATCLRLVTTLPIGGICW
jgi:hypothetical protein